MRKEAGAGAPRRADRRHSVLQGAVEGRQNLEHRALLAGLHACRKRVEQEVPALRVADARRTKVWFAANSFVTSTAASKPRFSSPRQASVVT
jgi:hypothetical protein